MFKQTLWNLTPMLISFGPAFIFMSWRSSHSLDYLLPLGRAMLWVGIFSIYLKLSDVCAYMKSDGKSDN
jgi:hypothetical protein